MRSSCVVLTALVALAAYYIYIPVPSSVSDPWKLMLLDATFRSAEHVCNLIHYLGLSHHLLAVNFIITSVGQKSAGSSARVKVTDTDFDSVEVRVFEGSPKPEEPLKRSVLYIHGGGWALGSAKIKYYDDLCTAMAEELNAVIVSIDYLVVFLCQTLGQPLFPRRPRAALERLHPGQARPGRKNYGRWRRLFHLTKRMRKATSGQRAPRPLRGQRPEWRRKRDVASEKGSWQNQRQGSQTQSQFQAQSQPRPLWQPQ